MFQELCEYCNSVLFFFFFLLRFSVPQEIYTRNNCNICLAILKEHIYIFVCVLFSLASLIIRIWIVNLCNNKKLAKTNFLLFLILNFVRHAPDCKWITKKFELKIQKTTTNIYIYIYIWVDFHFRFPFV